MKRSGHRPTLYVPDELWKRAQGLPVNVSLSGLLRGALVAACNDSEACQGDGHELGQGDGCDRCDRFRAGSGVWSG